MSDGARQQGLVDSYGDRLEAIADQSARNLNAALERALTEMLRDLRRWYAPFLDPTITSASGGRVRGATIAESASRFQGLVEAAQGYLSDEQLDGFRQQFQRDLTEAMATGGELSVELLRTVSDAVQERWSEPNQVAIWKASEMTTAYIRSETLKFRSQVTQIVTEAAARGHGYRRMISAVEDALRGSTDPDGITRRLGLRQRAELIARSELANAYVQAQKRVAKESGFEYVRRIAAKDERTCALCMSRHGHVYRVDEVTGTAHPRCRCSLASVPNEAVEEKDPELRRELLDLHYWERSQARAVEELRKGKGWDEERVKAEVSKALRTITPSERHQQPDRKTTVQPVA